MDGGFPSIIFDLLVTYRAHKKEKDMPVEELEIKFDRIIRKPDFWVNMKDVQLNNKSRKVLVEFIDKLSNAIDHEIEHPIMENKLDNILGSNASIKVQISWWSDKEIDVDVDGFIFMLNNNEQLPKEKYFVFYNNMSDPSLSVCLNDEVTSEFGREQFDIDFSLVPNFINNLSLGISVYEDKATDIKNLSVHIMDTKTNKEIFRYEVPMNILTDSAGIIGEIRQGKDGWSVSAYTKQQNTNFRELYGKFSKSIWGV